MAFQTPFLFGTGKPSAFNDRWIAMGGHYCEGVGPASSGGSPQSACLVTQTATASMGARIGPGWVYVKGDDVVNQGFYCAFNNAQLTVPNPNGAPSAAGSQRIDLLVVQFVDSEASVASTPPQDQMTPVWVAGGVLSGTGALDDYVVGDTYPAGWPAMPKTAILLAAAEIRTGDTTIVTARIRDLRRLYGPGIWGEDGKFYRLGVDATGSFGIEEVTSAP